MVDNNVRNRPNRLIGRQQKPFDHMRCFMEKRISLKMWILSPSRLPPPQRARGKHKGWVWTKTSTDSSDKNNHHAIVKALCYADGTRFLSTAQTQRWAGCGSKQKPGNSFRSRFSVQSKIAAGHWVPSTLGPALFVWGTECGRAFRGSFLGSVYPANLSSRR